MQKIEKEKLCVCLQELKETFDFIKYLMEAASMSSKGFITRFLKTYLYSKLLVENLINMGLNISLGLF